MAGRPCGNYSMIDPKTLTEQEIHQIELGRQIKSGTGHGTLMVEYNGGVECLFTMDLKFKPRAPQKRY